MDVLVCLEDIGKSYKKHHVLEGINLEIGSGITGLLGPNGAGKTTLIKILLGLVKINKGKGRVLGYTLGHEERKIRSKVGYMPEDDFYISGLTGIEAIQMAARLSGLPALEGLRRGHEILDFCGIDQERYRPVETYSTGMRQKLKFAQAIVHDPKFLILDEPTSGLDPEERIKMLNRIRLLAKKANKAVLISTHILHDVQAVCDQVIILATGKVKLTETMNNLQKPLRPAYHLKVVGDSQPFLAKLQEEGWECEFENNIITVNTDDEKFTERVWKIAQENKWGIQRLLPASNSLEQIFLDAVKGS